MLARRRWSFVHSMLCDSFVFNSANTGNWPDVVLMYVTLSDFAVLYGIHQSRKKVANI